MFLYDSLFLWLLYVTYGEILAWLLFPGYETKFDKVPEEMKHQQSSENHLKIKSLIVSGYLYVLLHAYLHVREQERRGRGDNGKKELLDKS